jgi:hypothetical protein
MPIDLDLLKQVRETADWFIGLPQKLVAAVMGTKLDYLDRRERILKSKELAELREIGKVIQSLYFFKGNILLWVNKVQTQKDIEDVEYVRDLFDSVAKGLDNIWNVMSETPLSNTQLGADVSMQIAKAKATYEALRDLPDQAILDDRGILDILASMEEMMGAGRLLLMQVDDHRNQIDNTYG